jgi:hypothetical protein
MLKIGSKTQFRRKRDAYDTASIPSQPSVPSGSGPSSGPNGPSVPESRVPKPVETGAPSTPGAAPPAGSGPR